MGDDRRGHLLPGFAADGDESAPQDLTPRQLEILALLSAGKANKEIAAELGIGLGTVKQHVVALFRKLQVTNRTMAVARGHDFGGSAAAGANANVAGGSRVDSIELRPVTVLSLACRGPNGAAASEAAWQQLQTATVLANQIADSILIGHPGAGVDVIFGLHRIHERNAEQALGVARDVFRRFVALWPAEQGPRPSVQGGMVSGNLLASVGATGDWNGEMVAGRLIAHARSVRDGAPPDGMLVDAAAQRLIAFANRAEIPFDEVPAGRPPLLVRLAADADGLPQHRSVAPPLLVGRAAETSRLRARLTALAAGQGGVVWVEGETGMGKTSLCRAVAAGGRNAAWQWLESRCGGAEAVGPLAVLGRSARTGAGPLGSQTIDDVVALVRRRLGRRPLVVLVDEIHEASEAETQLLLRLVEMAQWGPLLLIGAGRGVRAAALRAVAAESIALGRMDGAEIAALVRATAAVSDRTLEQIVHLARGVPLFARELAWEWRTGPGTDEIRVPLSLTCLVMARIDGLALDHTVLKAVAWQGPIETAALLAGPGPLPPRKLAQEIERAVVAGVVASEAGAGGQIVSITHPLVAAVLRHVMPTTDGATAQTKG
jgi:DNA-binding CsgD family transcriptional regulator